MARVKYPTEATVPSPLLIGADQLEALDLVIDKHLAALTGERERRIDELTEKEMGDRIARGWLKEDQVESERAKVRESVARYERLGEDSRSLTVYLPRGKLVEAGCFAEAISHPLGEEETPLGFLVYLRVGEVKARVSLNSSWREDLQISVEPNDLEVAQSLFGALRNWASDVEAPKWQQRWLRYRLFFVYFLFLWLFMGLVYIPLIKLGDSATRVQKAEARKLLAGGVTQANEQRAIELLLAIESDYDPGVPAWVPGLRYWLYFGLGALFLAAACICPRVSIGIWKGKRRLKQWRFWIKTVTVSVPLFIVTSILLPWPLHFLGFGPPGP
jgi:hypothetical protein